MKLIEVEWDAYGTMRLRPAKPWPPHESLRDVGEVEALQLLLEASEEVLQPKSSTEVVERYRERVIEVRRRISKEQAHGIAVAFARKCYLVARERADVAATFGDSRDLPAPPPEAEPVSVEEEVQKWRQELDQLLSRHRPDAHGS